MPYKAGVGYYIEDSVATSQAEAHGWLSHCCEYDLVRIGPNGCDQQPHHKHGGGWRCYHCRRLAFRDCKCSYCRKHAPWTVEITDSRLHRDPLPRRRKWTEIWWDRLNKWVAREMEVMEMILETRRKR